MLHLYSADRAEPLARRLADVLSDDPGDPMSSEWLAVPTEGMRRWVGLELARYLGASDGGHGDGVAANFVRAFPGTLRSEVLEAAGGGPDPWHIDRMVWSLVDVYERLDATGEESSFTRLAGGASRFTRVRAVADLFDRYHLHRPEMVRAWARGEPVDGGGGPLAPHVAWQYRVWVLLRNLIDRPSPPEVMPTVLDAVRSGGLEVALPDRLLLFGFTTLPGRDFVDLVSAVAVRRQVHLFLLGPSRLDGRLLQGTWPRPVDGRQRSRAVDPTASLVHHPLLRSWGRVARETALLLADAGTDRPDMHAWVGDTGADVVPSTLLGRLQYDIRHDTTSTLETVGPDDRSVQFHACFGQMRQAEVARDAVLHALAADPSLTEEDVLVVCPGLERFAPLVEAAFGGPPSDVDGGAPRLRFQIADRSIRSVNPVVGSLVQMVGLLSSRFEVAPVVDFLSSLPVRQRFGLDDDALGVLADWVDRTHVRWGLDAHHRSGFAMPASVDGNTWRAALDRLLLGSATVDDRLLLAIGDVAPMEVGSGDATTLGALAEVLDHLAGFAAWCAEGRHALVEWIERLVDSCGQLLATPDASAWQFDALHRVLGEILDDAGPGDGAGGPALDLGDVQRLLDGKLGSEAGRPDFFRGGVTVTSMTPLRWVPFRVVCILGLDQEFMTAPASDAADLVAASPQVGDPDRRIEWRQSLLEAVLAAQDRLIVVRSGHDVRTSQEVPRAVAAAELFDALVGLVPDGQRQGMRRLEVTHPRHGFDPRCLEPDGIVAGTTWSFDPDDLVRAGARRTADRVVGPPARPAVTGVDTGVIDLDDLRRFLADPVGSFATSAVQMAFPHVDDVDDVILPVESGPLETSGLGRRMLEARRSGATAAEWLEVERRSGTLPPGALESRTTRPLVDEVDALVAEADRLGVRTGNLELVDIDVELDERTRIVGSVPLALPDETPGPAWVRFTRSRPTFTLDAWLPLMALVATDLDRPWRSVFLSRGDKDEPFTSVDLVVRGAGADRRTHALRALTVAVECFRAGMREPLPLFPSFSKSVADGSPDLTAWTGRNGRGDREKPATAFFFGRLSGTDLLALEAEPGDPPGSGGRVQRWADHLWGTVAATSTGFPS